MCIDPATALAVTALATGAQAYAAYQAAEATNDAAKYNAQVLERNAEITDAQAIDVEVRGVEAERRLRQRVSRFKGVQRASIAASGAVVDEGSPLEILQETARFGELDALTLRAGAAREAWGYRVEGLNLRTKADISRAGRVSPGLAVGTTLLSGGSELGKQFVNYKQKGLI